MTEILKPSRRGFITGAVSLLVAPAIVRVENIMPVKAVKFIGRTFVVTDYSGGEFTGVDILYGVKSNFIGNCFGLKIGDVVSFNGNEIFK